MVLNDLATRHLAVLNHQLLPYDESVDGATSPLAVQCTGTAHPMGYFLRGPWTHISQHTSHIWSRWHLSVPSDAPFEKVWQSE